MQEFLVIDDHALVRTGLVLTLQGLDPTVVVYEAGDVNEALAVVRDKPHLRLVITDLRLPVIDGLAGLALIQQIRPGLPVVVVSAQYTAQDVQHVMERGAMGFIPKAYSSNQILRALQRVLNGERYRPSDFEDYDTRPMPLYGNRAPALTDRQMQVLALMVQGKSNKVICDELGAASGTIKIHISSVLRALKVTNRTQAVLAASKLGLRL